MAKTSIMIDLETLSTKTNATILTIGAVKFDPLANENVKKEFDKLYIKIDLDSCDKLGLDVSESTLEWWAKQSEEAKAEAFSEGGRVDIREAFQQLRKFCFGATHVWSNGAAFDVVICETIFDKLGIAPPWNFWQVRDVRTIFDLGIDPKRPKVTAHNALEDAIAQAICVQNVYRVLSSASTSDGTYITPFSNSIK